MELTNIESNISTDFNNIIQDKYIQKFKSFEDSSKFFYIKFGSVIIILIFLIILFYFIFKTINEVEIEIDNQIKEIYYQKNLDYSQYSTKIKVIAIYFPNYDIFKRINNSQNIKIFDELKFRCKQGRIPETKYINQNIEYKMKLAKFHGIYGFAIYFYSFSGKILLDKSLDIVNGNKIKFKYMLIWKKENIFEENNKISIKKEYNEISSKYFFKYIKKYLINKNYITIDGKPIIGINNPSQIPNLNKTIIIWRNNAKKLGIGDILIISCLDIDNLELNNIKILDGGFMISKNDLNHKITNNSQFFIFNYFDLLNKNSLYENKIKNYSNIEKKNNSSFKSSNINREFFGESFHFFLKDLIKLIKFNHNNSNEFIFFNSWNNYFDGTFLEPDEKYGYNFINTLSKALFNLPFRDNNYTISNLLRNCLIAVHAHIFYEDLLDEIINKTNNIPVKFDLFITTDTSQKKEYIENFTKKYSKANNTEIKIVKNKGRDVLPFFIQMEDIIYRYKYFCHIHSKKSKHKEGLGYKWRTYLYNNLLGNNEIIAEILSDFENYDKLGFAFPENYREIINSTKRIEKLDRKCMNILLSKLFQDSKYITGYKLIDFPAGNMFWARVEAVHQIFKINIKYIIQEMLEKDSSLHILYAIERIWLYIVKINGFYYKKYYYK